MTVVYFVAVVVGDIDQLHKERYALFKAGLSPVDWMLLTKWQRLDLLARHMTDAKMHGENIKRNKLGGVVSALVSRILGV